MAYFTRVAAHVAGGGKEHTTHVHELAEGEVHQKHTQEGEVSKKDGTKIAHRLGRKRDHPHDENLCLCNIDLVEIAHADTGSHESKQEEQREKVVGQRNIAYLRIDQTPSKQKEQRNNHEHVGHEHARNANLHDAVKEFQPAEAGRNRIGKEPEMTEENDQEAVVEQQRKHPQPLGREVGRTRPYRTHLGGGIAEQ